jgi:membrane protein implicated in regulation of membrane protease activity
MIMVLTMIIVWAVVTSVSLLIEFLTLGMVTTWFAVGGIVALITAACGLYYPWQVLVFFVVSLGCLLALRRFVTKFLRVKTVPTNLDANIGLKVKLLKDVVGGRSEIKVNDTVWTAVCDSELKEGGIVVITSMSGNKYIVEEVK